jgi:hypothetical protein
MQCNFSLWEFPCVSDSKVTPQAILAIVKIFYEKGWHQLPFVVVRTNVSFARRNQHTSQLLRKPVYISPPLWQKPWVVWWRLRAQALFKTLDSHPPKKWDPLTYKINKPAKLWKAYDINNIENTCLRHPTRPLIAALHSVNHCLFSNPLEGLVRTFNFLKIYIM